MKPTATQLLFRLLSILTCGTVIYLNSFEVPFLLDDLTSIIQNPVITQISSYRPGGPGYDFLPQRLVGYFSFALNYHFGGLDVIGYHLFNLGVHLGAALLVYALVSLSFRTPQLASSRLAPRAATAALLAALVFVAHPVQTQAVTYIVQRLTSLATLFYLLAVVLYVAARLRCSDSGLGSARHRQPLLLLAAATLAAVLAMKTKEIAFTLPFALILYEICFFRGPWKRRLCYLLPLLATLPIIPLTLLTAGETIGDDLSEVDDQLRVQTDLPRLHYLLTQFRVIVTYLRLLVWPVKQNLDYDFPVYTSLFHPQVLGSLALLSVIFGLAVYLYYRSAQPRPAGEAFRVLSRDPALRLIAFGILWFFLTLTVESSIIPITDLIFEHRLYLPSFGMAAVFAILAVLASEHFAPARSGTIPLLGAALIILGLGVASYQRNLVWRSEISLWEDVVGKSPQKVRAWNNLGFAMSAAGRVEESIGTLQRAVQVDSQYAGAWLNLGRSYLIVGRNGDAIRALQRAVALEPEMENAIINLGVALIRAGRSGEAARLLEQNLHLYADRAEARLNLGAAYANIRNFAAARRELAAIHRLDPRLAPPLADLIDRTAKSPGSGE